MARGYAALAVLAVLVLIVPPDERDVGDVLDGD